MAARKTTIGQKKALRQAEVAKAQTKKKLGGDAIDKVIADVNAILGGVGHVYRGGAIKQRAFERRSSGIPTVDYILGGGIPKGCLIEIGGEYSTGKTTLCLLILAYLQRTEPEKAAFWVALEPFSKTWAREVGYWLPFDETIDANTGEAVDPFEKATDLEKLRMEQLGITDPYEEISPFVLVQEERGDVALDAALKLMRSNRFAYGVVDSLGVAKSTKWLEENEVQDAGDFPREAKMIGDYTTRACLMLNKRYDENGMEAKDGAFPNETTMFHLNHVGVDIGSQARAQHKKMRIKGGEGNKHNHHAIIFLWKGEQKRFDKAGQLPYVYGQEVNAITIKSKVCAPFKQGSYDFYFKPFAAFHPGDVNVAKDAITLALLLGQDNGLITRSGSWFELWDGTKTQGTEQLETYLRANPEHLQYLIETVAERHR